MESFKTEFMLSTIDPFIYEMFVTCVTRVYLFITCPLARVPMRNLLRSFRESVEPPGLGPELPDNLRLMDGILF